MFSFKYFTYYKIILTMTSASNVLGIFSQITIVAIT